MFALVFSGGFFVLLWRRRRRLYCDDLFGHGRLTRPDVFSSLCSILYFDLCTDTSFLFLFIDLMTWFSIDSGSTPVNELLSFALYSQFWFLNIFSLSNFNFFY